ncbi:DNA polymerase III subunit beta [Schleiferilactobacillus harbinensis]|jgi:DNA polymerase-3 subunit beta|uniref:Beta sliding clamp n=1 Tax=Schleiferilactobacillus harbinensis TaxID=304207 RepID=A0A510TW20_9LACO|nr:DNA polymerase III subunit beta [Schleiferilactobacillus harbinensis]MCI1686675.1 DNA polymerase III subunit beta [Schleiferilactobacillus harbinensis]MCI1783774.1 DNA polymerase III subunit beta [Schleiferilactobacillus harbinensis]MCI1849363.1 DNA polymerase III subunit beta [Schleiferilactobacillus harbinensis]QEU48084.1 DNA polymerase III subunit beta [Schleiferilactobacillus harbinensis]QFR25120.1 DNA polymerase III subunit beta [Schleiferilactobacillus harbinensis]
MKFTINRDVFIKTLNDVSRAIATKTTIPILTGLKLTLDQEKLTFTGSDADISIEASIPVSNDAADLQVAEPGSIVLPSRFFTEIVKRLPEKDMTIAVTDTLQAVITSGQSEFTINGSNSDEYPLLPEIADDHALQLPADVLREVIGQTVIAVSTQDSRPILTGVHIVIHDGAMLAVATDTHRLAQRIVRLEGAGDADYDINVPGRSLVELARTIPDSVDTIDVRIAENQVLFLLGNTAFYSRLLEGNYPDTQRLLPTEHTTAMTVAAASFQAAIERASLLSHESRNNVVRLVLTPEKNTAVLSSTSPDVGTVQEEIAFKALTGDTLDISFNPDYMKDALRVVGQSDVTMDFTSALRPFTIQPTEDTSQFIQLITPIRTF